LCGAAGARVEVDASGWRGRSEPAVEVSAAHTGPSSGGLGCSERWGAVASGHADAVERRVRVWRSTGTHAAHADAGPQRAGLRSAASVARTYVLVLAIVTYSDAAVAGWP
jgi:hypothetical protein